VKVSKDSIDLGMIVTDEKAVLNSTAMARASRWKGVIPLPGGRMYRFKIGITFLKLLKLEKTPTVSTSLNDLEHGGQFALPRLKLSESIKSAGSKDSWAAVNS